MSLHLDDGDERRYRPTAAINYYARKIERGTATNRDLAVAVWLCWELRKREAAT